MVEKQKRKKKGAKQSNALIWTVPVQSTSQDKEVRLRLGLCLWVKEIRVEALLPTRNMSWLGKGPSPDTGEWIKSPTREQREVQVVGSETENFGKGGGNMVMPQSSPSPTSLLMHLSLFPSHSASWFAYNSHSPPLPKLGFCPHSLTSLYCQELN